jgi:Na+/phosphate symporter
MSLKETRFRETSHYVYRPEIMFFLGFLITMLTTSVSVSLGLLVPLSARGYVKVENLVPYIMGANISTFIDSLIVAILLTNPSAFTIVFVGIISTTLVSSMILIFFFHVYEKFLLDSLLMISHSNRNLTAFLITTFFIPILLLLI